MPTASYKVQAVTASAGISAIGFRHSDGNAHGVIDHKMKKAGREKVGKRSKGMDPEG